MDHCRGRNPSRTKGGASHSLCSPIAPRTSFFLTINRPLLLEISHPALFKMRLPLDKPQAQQAPLAQAHQVCKIPYASYPHIVESIAAHSDYTTLLAFRATCSSLLNSANSGLCDGTLRVTLEDDSDEEAIVLRSGVGVLPFGQKKWASVLRNSMEVEVDGRCVSGVTFSTNIGTLGTPLVELYELSKAQAQKARRRLEKVAVLQRALHHLPRSTPVTITHTAEDSTPAYLPLAAKLTCVLDPTCDCLAALGPEPPNHSATHVTLVFRSGRDKERDPDATCGLMLAAIAPCVEHLIVSIVNFTDADPVFHALAMLFVEGDERPVFSSRFKFEFRVRHLDPGEANEDQCATLAAEWRLRRDQLSIVQDEAAGIL